MNQLDIEECAKLRKLIFLTGYKGGMAHLASCYSCLEIIYTLYVKGVLRYDPQDPSWKDRDRFVLSKGHGALALYAVLCKTGVLSKKELGTYLQPGCHIGGEPCARNLPCIEATTGSLGHGLPMAVGMALGQKIDGMPAKTYVLLGDGECQEGSIWEAAMAASSMQLDNLVVILDANGLQKTNRVDETLRVVSWQEKWESFGWTVRNTDGHDMDQLCQTLRQPPGARRPTLIIAHTVKGKGVPLMENDPKWHFRLPNRKELKQFQRALQISDKELE